MSILDLMRMIKNIPGSLSFHRSLHSSSHNVHCAGSNVFVFSVLSSYDQSLLILPDLLIPFPFSSSFTFLFLFSSLRVLLHAAVETTICPGTVRL